MNFDRLGFFFLFQWPRLHQAGNTRGVSSSHCLEDWAALRDRKQNPATKFWAPSQILSLLNESGGCHWGEISPQQKCVLQSALFGKVLMQRQAAGEGRCTDGCWTRWDRGKGGGKEAFARLLMRAKVMLSYTFRYWLPPPDTVSARHALRQQHFGERLLDFCVTWPRSMGGLGAGSRGLGATQSLCHLGQVTWPFCMGLGRVR